MHPSNVVVTPPERRMEIRLRDGRALAWSEWGRADGDPVLFCTGAGMSGWLGFGADDLGDLGLRLLAIDRPGLGRSHPHPDKSLETWAEDVRALIEARDLGRPLCVGFSQGAPFAFALAGRDLVRAMAIVSGQDQMAHPRVRPLLHPDVAGMLAEIEGDAAEFERRLAGMVTWEWLWGLILRMSGGRDLALYRDEAFGAAYERSLGEGFSQGTKGYARDLVLSFGAWAVEPEDVAIPVDLWYGGRDTSTVHSPDGGAILATRLRHGSHVLDPDEGGSILWTRSRDILAKLKSHLLGG